MCKRIVFLLVSIMSLAFVPLAHSQDVEVWDSLNKRRPNGWSASPSTKDSRSSGADALLEQMARAEAVGLNELKRQQKKEFELQEMARLASEEHQRRYNSPAERAKQSGGWPTVRGHWRETL